MEKSTAPVRSDSPVHSNSPESLQAKFRALNRNQLTCIALLLAWYLCIFIFLAWFFHSMLYDKPDWKILVLPSSSPNTCSFETGQEFQAVSSADGCHTFNTSEEVHAMLWTSGYFSEENNKAERFGNCTITLYSDESCSGSEVRRIEQASARTENPREVFCESDFIDEDGVAIGARSVRTECH